MEDERIDIQDDERVAHWSGKLDATPEQLREAVEAGGDRVAAVEMHLKGSRSTSNSDRVHDAL